MPFGAGYVSIWAIVFSVTPNYIYRLDTATPTADKYQINNLSGGRYFNCELGSTKNVLA